MAALARLLLLFAILSARQSSSPVDGYQAELHSKQYEWWVRDNCSNLGVEDSERNWFEISWAAISAGQAVLLVIGLANNTLNIICLHSDKTPAAQNVLLLSMAACDWFIVLIMSVDTVCHISGNVNGVPWAVHWTCVYLHPFPITGLQFALLTIHGWTTVALAFVRFLAIRFPFRSRTWITRRRLRMVAGCVWLAGLATGLPRLTDTFAVVCTDREAAFMIGQSQFPVYSTVHTWGLQFGLPVALCILLNVQVTLAVSRSKQPDSSQDEAQRQASVTRMVLSVTTIYVICQSFSVFFFLNTVLRWKRAAFELLDLVGNFVYTLDASLSFFVYLATNASFRAELRRVLRMSQAGARAEQRYEANRPSANTASAVSVVMTVEAEL